MSSTDVNKATRSCCDVDIRNLENKEPFLFFDKANVTTVKFSTDDTYAKAKGRNRIAFSNPMDNSTMTIEAQIVPFKLYALISDGIIDTNAIVADKATIKCATAGKVTVPTGVTANSVFVYAEGDFGGTSIKGTLSGSDFTATTPTDIAVDSSYEVAYLITKSSNVQKVSFNNSKNPKNYYITMKTVKVDEDGNVTAQTLIGYKCKPQKSLDLSYSSTGDAQSMTITLSCLEDKDGNVIDLVDDTTPEA